MAVALEEEAAEKASGWIVKWGRGDLLCDAKRLAEKAAELSADAPLYCWYGDLLLFTPADVGPRKHIPGRWTVPGKRAAWGVDYSRFDTPDRHETSVGCASVPDGEGVYRAVPELYGAAGSGIRLAVSDFKLLFRPYGSDSDYEEAKYEGIKLLERDPWSDVPEGYIPFTKWARVQAKARGVKNPQVKPAEFRLSGTNVEIPSFVHSAARVWGTECDLFVKE